MAKKQIEKEVYFKQKYNYLLELSQAPNRLVFQNIKAAVDYINRLGLFKEVKLADYQNVVNLLRSGQSWNYLSSGLTLKLQQIEVYGKRIRSARKVKEVAQLAQEVKTLRKVPTRPASFRKP